MFVRLTFLSISPEKKEKLKKTYTEEVVPVVKKQMGNLGVRLLEPTVEGQEFISVTEWATANDAELYEASGIYRTLVDLLKEAYLSKPVLKTYNEVESTVDAVL
jgi:heme-degrading monooxygenase HmoA